MMNDDTKNKVGKPLIFKTVKELQNKIDDYFDYCDNRIKQIHTKDGDEVAITHPAPYTMSGLARYLGISRQTLIDYKNRDEYLDAIKQARSKVEEDVERRLLETQNQSGAIFNLKNNFGWKDKTEQDITSKGLPIPLLAGIAPNELEVDDGVVETNDSTDQNQPTQ